MPSFVITEKCDGCKAQDKTACQYICPHDLMALDREKMKAYNQEPEQCWECFNCVKICPQQAIEVRGYSDFVPLGSSTIPLRGTDSIMWTIKVPLIRMQASRRRILQRLNSRGSLTGRQEQNRR